MRARVAAGRAALLVQLVVLEEVALVFGKPALVMYPAPVYVPEASRVIADLFVTSTMLKVSMPVCLPLELNASSRPR